VIVLSDTTPLNYLVLIDQASILPALFGEIYVPQAVCEELGNPASPQKVRDWILQAPAWLVVRAPATMDESLRLGRGETETIGLALELNADLLLMDDRVARNAAKRRNLNVAGTVNVLEAAARRDLLDLRAAIATLRTTNFHISEGILAELLRAYDAWRKDRRP
jgi:predicted nucleic acid-binding protein